MATTGDVTLDYIAAGGNRHPSAADWAPGILAFGAGNNVAVWNPEHKQTTGIAALLNGHNDSVSAVGIWNDAERQLIITGSADKTIRLWRSRKDGLRTFQQIQVLVEHQGSLNTISTLATSGIFASGSADGTVKIWTIAGDEAKLLQSISLKPRYLPLTTALTSLADGAVVLAVAGTSTAIQLYVRSEAHADFELQATLTGHEGWIRSLDFVIDGESTGRDVLLASASQDKYIRLWRFRKGATNEMNGSADHAMALIKKSLSNKAHQVGKPGSKYAVTFEALLIGHEDWIYTVRWAPKTKASTSPLLLSASADNSLSIWTADETSGLWVCSTRLGEISSQKGSTTATGSTGGFWMGLWQPDGRSVVSLGRTGSWRRWCYDSPSDTWVQEVGISGHTQEVQSLAWAPDGSYLLSTSSDQTTRLFAQWQRDSECSWHEFARPQIHGYDLNCVDALNPNQFISGADEKLLRVFNKPRAIRSLLSRLSGAQAALNGDLPEAANIPVLGLSNKAIEAVADHEPADGLANGDVDEREAVDTGSVVHKPTLDLDHPPLEDHLARHTLWPEHEKLYGHGYEISAVAASHDGSLVATACKASSLDHAVIRLYETKYWREIKPSLTAHSLTVTSMAFSESDRYLLSVGRDRQWALFQRDDGDVNTYKALSSNPKGHSRMILDCSWAQERNDTFATAGRDKTVKLWRIAEESAKLASTITAQAPVTAVAFSPDTTNDEMRLAYGTEDGTITICTVAADTLQVAASVDIDRSLLPSKAVNALSWRPNVAERHLQLAAASDDFSVRLYNLAR